LENLDYIHSLINLCFAENKESFVHSYNELQQKSNWKNIAKVNFLLPLVFYRAKKLGALSALQQKDSELADKQLKRASVKNLKLNHAFSKLYTIALNNNIEITAIKGVYLQHYLYPESYLRQMVDIDILVAASKVEELRKKLVIEGAIPITVHQSRFIESLLHQISPIKLNDVSIEIHRNLFDSFDEFVCPEALIASNSRVETLSGHKVKVLNNEFLLVYLCCHVFNTIRGGSLRLISLIDIFLLLNKSNINVEQLNSIAKEMNATLALQNILYLVSKLFKVETPCCPSTPENIELFPISLDYAIKIFLSEQPPFDTSHYFTKFKKINGFKNKTKYILHAVFPQQEYIKNRYLQPPFTFSKLCQAYIIHIASFIRTGNKTIFHFLRQKRA